jgi:hypothetical protein
MNEIVGHGLAMRKSGEGFKNEQTFYELSLANASALPRGAEQLRHTMRWPIDIGNLKVHITTYFDQPNYSDPSQGEHHKGIDIQVPEGFPIVTPEDAIVVKVDTEQMNKAREMADILLYSEESGLAYWLVHLDVHSVPIKLLERHWFDKWSDVKVKKVNI